MPAPLQDNSQYTRRFFVFGLFMLGLVWFTPLTMDTHGHSFIALARSSLWSNFGDWQATWCSFKIMLLGLSGFLLISSIIEFLVALERDVIAIFLGFLIIIPIGTFLLGCYYLLKALF